MKTYHTLKEDLVRILENADPADRNPLSETVLLDGLTYGADHQFPDPERLVRLAEERGVGIHRALALVLKAQWERDFSCGSQGWSPDSGTPLGLLLTEAREADIRAADFNPDTHELFAWFERANGLASRAGYGVADFDTVVQQMILSELHRVPNPGPELKHFAAAETTRIAILGAAAPEDREAFWVERCRWTRLQEALDDIHVQAESRRLRNAETRRAYLALFGKEEVALQETIYRHCDLNRRKLLKEANPELRRDQLDDLVAEEEARHRKELADLAFQTDMAPCLERHLPGDGGINYERLREYKEQAKRLLRQLRMKIHPDHLRHDPAYQRLTDGQKKELERLLHAAVGVTTEELGFPAGYVEHDMRTVEGLSAALARVDAILRNAGIDTRVEWIIQGETLAEQRAWLEESCASIERRTESARAEWHALATDPEVERMQGVLDAPGQHAEIRRELRRKTAWYTEQADILKEELDRWFETKDKEVP